MIRWVQTGGEPEHDVSAARKLGELVEQLLDTRPERRGAFGADAGMAQIRAQFVGFMGGHGLGCSLRERGRRALSGSLLDGADDEQARRSAVEPLIDGADLPRPHYAQQPSDDQNVDMVGHGAVRPVNGGGQLGDGRFSFEQEIEDRGTQRIEDRGTQRMG